MANVPFALLTLAGGSVLIWAGVTDPPGGFLAAAGSVLRGQPVQRKAASTSSPLDFVPAIYGGGASSSPSSSAGTVNAGLVTPGASAAGAAIVATARRYLGVPYRWGGTNPATGLDCSGLTQLVYGQHGIKLGRTTYQQQNAGQLVAKGNAAPGDLVLWGAPAAHHVGIYLGNGRVIHAPQTGDVVKEAAIWSPSTVTYRRVVAAAAAAAPAAPANSFQGVI